MQFCFAMEIRGQAKLILGNKAEPRRMEGKGQVLTNHDISPLVIDSVTIEPEDTISLLHVFTLTSRPERSSR